MTGPIGGVENPCTSVSNKIISTRPEKSWIDWVGEQGIGRDGEPAAGVVGQ